LKRFVRHTVELPEDRPLTVAVVADTHSRPHPSLGERLAALAPDLVLHAGDIGDLEVLTALERQAPRVVAVRGNIDTGAAYLPDVAVVTFAGAQGKLVVLMTHVAVYGPKLRADVKRLAAREDADLVVCGHSHVPFVAREGALTVLNPGSVGPRRFRLPIVMAVVVVGREGVRVSHLDVETGEPFAPPPAIPRAV
jgi:putative phosphoesterase